MSDEKKEGTTTAGSVGFQIPMGIKQRKEKVDELLKAHPDIHEGDVLSYWHGMDDKEVDTDCQDLDKGDHQAVADRVRSGIVRKVVQNRVREVVRKKPGGGGYVLYSPNSGKKKQAKPVGNFPTKLGAKKAELARFPPKEPGKLKRLRKEVDRLLKDPKKRAEKEKVAAKQVAPKAKDHSHPKPKVRKEGLELVRESIRSAIKEALFHEEKTGSDWDDLIGRLSKQAVQADSKLQKLQKTIEKSVSKVLDDSFSAIAKNVDKKKVKLKNHGVKSAPDSGKTYLAFSATMDNVECGPIAIYVEAGTPKIELSDQAKAALTKADPSTSKLFRAELVTVQERILDKMDDLERAIANRDRYLTSMEDSVDEYVAELTPLQVSLLKSLLVKKYRKM